MKDMFDIVWISTSFLCGLLVFFGKLPPMIGYLCAGFILHFFGISSFQGLDELSELGISLLLFSIGLKLDLKSLIKTEVLGIALAQSLVSFGVILLFKMFLDQSESLVSSSIIAFALTFSSTIFVVKILDQRGDFHAKYGKISIGILIIQDILAVLFMAVGTQKAPSPWFLLVIFGLIPLRYLLSLILNKIKHAELIVLFGLTVSLGGAYLFDLVNVKGDIGALVMGIILGSHARADELNDRLMAFKDFFLLGFFLSIGMIGLPSIDQFYIAITICLFLPLRLVIYFFLFNRFGLRNRNSFLASSTLTNFSEFGLIVCSFAVTNNMLESHWLTTLALTLAISFIFSAILNSRAEKIYLRYSNLLLPLQPTQLQDYEKAIDLKDADVLIIGMGRVGKGAYQYFIQEVGYKPLGIELEEFIKSDLTDKNINCIVGNATNPDFWNRVDLANSSVKHILLTMPIVRQNCIAASLIRLNGFKHKISSTCKYPNEEQPLLESGIDSVFNLYAEAGVGFAQSSCKA